MTLQEMGFVKHHGQGPNVLASEKYNQKPAYGHLITFEHFAGGFLILVVGYTLAALVHLISWLWFHYGLHVLQVLHLTDYTEKDLNESHEHTEGRVMEETEIGKAEHDSHNRMGE